MAKYCPPLGKVGTLLQLGVQADKSAAEVSAGEDWAADNHGANYIVSLSDIIPMTNTRNGYLEMVRPIHCPECCVQSPGI